MAFEKLCNWLEGGGWKLPDPIVYTSEIKAEISVLLNRFQQDKRLYVDGIWHCIHITENGVENWHHRVLTAEELLKLLYKNAVYDIRDRSEVDVGLKKAEAIIEEVRTLLTSL